MSNAAPASSLSERTLNPSTTWSNSSPNARALKAVVIGSGFGGLGSAIRLATRGYDVTLLESRDQLGGRAYVYRQDGFTFDAGPTVITAPFLIDELFEGAGRKTSDYVKIVPVDPFYKIEFHDGTSFSYNADEQATIEKIRKFAPDDVDGYQRMIRAAKAIFAKGFVELSAKPFLKFMDMMKIAPDLIKLESHLTVYQFASRYVKDDRLRRVFSFHPLLVGGNPFSTTSIYALIHHLEREWGVHYAMGGTGAVVSALGKLFGELGGKTRLSTAVERIVVKDGRAAGVQTVDGETINADIVVSNADINTTYRTMVSKEHRRRWTDRKLAGMKYSMSLFVIYFGTRKKYENIEHHTILLCERYKELLADIFDRKVLPDDFSMYLHRPSKTDPSMAPDGCDCFYVLIPVPNQLSGIDWNKEGKPFRDRVMNWLDQNYMPGLNENLATERYFTPLDFETTLRSYAGAAFSFEPIFTQSAWFRPHNESEDVENLYFAGAGTHPGAGMPGVLCSAKIVEDLVCQRQPLR
ncbi:MAG: phytoene desaturase [Acidobacteria bacterium]|nr:phytoene desaturase [Acidobacteriota bacterium]